MKRPLTLLIWLLLIPAAAHAMRTTITPSISVRTTYTDNVDRVSDEQDPEHDFITSVSPAIALTAEHRTYGVSLAYSPSRVYYERTRDDQFWRHQGTLNGWSTPTKHTRLTLSGSYLQSEDAADLDNQDYTDTRVSGKYQDYSANAGFSYQFAEYSNLNLGAGAGGREYEDPSEEDSRNYRGSMGLKYGFNHQWSTNLNAGYSRGEFDGETDDFDNLSGSIGLAYQINKRMSANVTYALTSYLSDLVEDENDDRVHDISAGFHYSVEEDMDLSINAGYFLRQSPDEDDESGFNGGIDFTKQFPRGTLGLSVGSGYDYTYFQAENLGFNTYYDAGIDASYDFTRRFSGSVRGSFRRSEYDQDNETIDNYTAGCALSYQLLEWLYCGAGYDVRVYKPEEDLEQYTDNRIYLSLTASKDFWIWR